MNEKIKKEIKNIVKIVRQNETLQKEFASLDGYKAKIEEARKKYVQKS